jgi:hypothetical protein
VHVEVAALGHIDEEGGKLKRIFLRGVEGSDGTLLLLGCGDPCRFTCRLGMSEGGEAEEKRNGESLCGTGH